MAPLGDCCADRQVARLTDLLVDPAAITWRVRARTAWFPGKRRARYTPEQREALRAASDRRARAEQARQTGALMMARQSLAPRLATRPALPDAGVTTSRPPAAATRKRPITASVAAVPPRRAATKSRQPGSTLASELRRAHERIAELEAELERHGAAERDLLRRVELAVGRRAA